MEKVPILMPSSLAKKATKFHYKHGPNSGKSLRLKAPGCILESSGRKPFSKVEATFAQSLSAFAVAHLTELALRERENFSRPVNES
jgi:hypothetical protein